ncbi:MAG: TetR/AcrR family transcriptional regulator [Pseudomonadota bacterium]
MPTNLHIETRRFADAAIDQPKRNRTRAALIDSAIAVVAEKGIDAATVQDMVRRSRLAHGTFYNHFDDREHILIEASIAILDYFERIMIHQAGHEAAGCRRMLIALYTLMTHASANLAFGHLIGDTIGRYADVTDRIRPPLRADLRAARRAGDVTVRLTVMVEEQIAALVGLAIKQQLAGRPRLATSRATCEAILRLLGQSPEKAASIVRDVLSRKN